jgi:hypothetical protein
MFQREVLASFVSSRALMKGVEERGSHEGCYNQENDPWPIASIMTVPGITVGIVTIDKLGSFRYLEYKRKEWYVCLFIFLVDVEYFISPEKGFWSTYPASNELCRDLTSCFTGCVI